MFDNKNKEESKICDVVDTHSQNLPVLDIDIFIVIVKFVSINTVICRLMVLNRHIRNELLLENYIMFNKLIKFYRLNSRLKRTSMLA